MAMRPHIIAPLMGLLMTVAGCAQQAPMRQGGAPPMRVERPSAVIAAAAKPKPRRQETCKPAHVDLPETRKAALFKQFAAERGGADGAVPLPSAGSASSNCRQAAR